MTPSVAEAAGTLDTLARVKSRTRFRRSGHWLVALVFGVVILGALPFYVRQTLVRTGHCHRFARDGYACTQSVGGAPFGRAFDPVSWRGGLGSWATVYWALAIAVGYGVVALCYRRRAQHAGVQSRLWPFVVVGLGSLGLVLLANHGAGAGPPDFWIRGTAAVCVIALGIIVLAILERSIPFAVFAAGFFAVALLVALYTVINLFHRLGISGPFRGAGAALPNLILPGAYLVVGGLCFLAGRRWRVRLKFTKVPK